MWCCGGYAINARVIQFRCIDVRTPFYSWLFDAVVLSVQLATSMSDTNRNGGNPCARDCTAARRLLCDGSFQLHRQRTSQSSSLLYKTDVLAPMCRTHVAHEDER